MCRHGTRLAKGWQGWRPGTQPPSSYERLRGFVAERTGMRPGTIERSAAQWADQDGNDMDPNPRPDGFHRADVRSLHEGPGFLQGVTPVGHHAPFIGSDDISYLQAHCCRCKAGKIDAVGHGKGVALIAVGCRRASGCVGRVGGSGHWRSSGWALLED
jgi:hypothetical protein